MASRKTLLIVATFTLCAAACGTVVGTGATGFGVATDAGGGGGASCSELAACCATLAPAERASCSDTVSGGSTTACSAYLQGALGAGGCGGSTPPTSRDGGGRPERVDGGFDAGGPLPTDPTDASMSGVSDSASTSTPDVALSSLDAAIASLAPAPAGLAGFAFLINHVVQQPMDCPGTHWQFAPYPGASDVGGCADTCGGESGWGPIPMGSCPGIGSVLLVNTGALELAYIAAPCWDVPAHTAYAPGGYPGGDFLAGVLAPGAAADITSVYNGGIAAVLGSAQPFSSPDASYASDEGQIAWPLGVQGRGDAATMYVAELEVRPSCQSVTTVW